MPASDYSELNGMPSACTESVPWQIDVVEVRVPYEDVDEVAIYQEPLISVDWPPDQYEMFRGEDSYYLDAPGISLGYQTPEEMDTLQYLRATAAATRNNTAFYHPEAKEAIVELAGEAWQLFSDNRRMYDEYENDISYMMPSGRGGLTVRYPLSVQDEDVIEATQSVDGIQARKNARDKIRENYLKGLYLLWCAMYGVSASLSFRENRKIYFEREQLPDWAPEEDEDLPGWGGDGPGPPPPVGPRPGRAPGQGPGPLPGHVPGQAGPIPGQVPGQEPPDTGYPGEDPGAGDGGQTGSSSKKKGGSGGAIIAAAIVGVVLLGSKR